MKKMLLYMALVLSIAASVLAVVNYFLEQSLLKQKEDVFGKLNELFHGKENYNVLFIGSSRTLVHVNPSIIDSVLTSNSFNAGFDGINIIESKMFLESYLERHAAPDVLVLTIDVGSLNVSDTTKLFDFPLYFPYMKNEFVKGTLNEFMPQTKLYGFLPLLKLAYYDDFKKYMALKAWIQPEGNANNILYKGYAPKNITWKGDERHSRFKIHYTKHGFDLLKQFLNICSVNKIKCALVYAPQTEELTSRIDHFKEYLKLINEAGNKFHATFYDYSGIPLTKNNNYFYNHLHLNSEGADIFSTLLANDLKKKFKNQ